MKIHLSSAYVAQLKFSKDIYRITNLKLERVGTFIVFFFARLGGNYLESHILSGNMVQPQSNLDSTRVWRRRIHQNNSLDRKRKKILKRERKKKETEKKKKETMKEKKSRGLSLNSKTKGWR